MILLDTHNPSRANTLFNSLPPLVEWYTNHKKIIVLSIKMYLLQENYFILNTFIWLQANVIGKRLFGWFGEGHTSLLVELKKVVDWWKRVNSSGDWHFVSIGMDYRMLSKNHFIWLVQSFASDFWCCKQSLRYEFTIFVCVCVRSEGNLEIVWKSLKLLFDEFITCVQKCLLDIW